MSVAKHSRRRAPGGQRRLRGGCSTCRPRSWEKMRINGWDEMGRNGTFWKGSSPSSNRRQRNASGPAAAWLLVLSCYGTRYCVVKPGRLQPVLTCESGCPAVSGCLIIDRDVPRPGLRPEILNEASFVASAHVDRDECGADGRDLLVRTRATAKRAEKVAGPAASPRPPTGCESSPGSEILGFEAYAWNRVAKLTLIEGVAGRPARTPCVQRGSVYIMRAREQPGKI
jgi:hypothetical protein